MGIDLNTTSALLGISNNKISSNVNDVLTSNAPSTSDILTSAFSVDSAKFSNLSKSQTSSFSNLEKFINDNIGDDNDKAKLLGDLKAVKSIIEFGDTSASLDPVFSLLAGLPGLNESTGISSQNSNSLLIDSLV